MQYQFLWKKLFCVVLLCIKNNNKLKTSKKKRFTFPRAVGIVVIPYPSILKSSDHTNQIHVVGLFQRFPSSLKAKTLAKISSKSVIDNTVDRKSGKPIFLSQTGRRVPALRCE